MTRDDIIRMAREAGMRVGTNLSGVVLVGSPAEIGLAHLTIEELERFAHLVAAAERVKRPRQWQGLTDDEKNAMVEWAHPDIIEAIELRLRERNETR